MASIPGKTRQIKPNLSPRKWMSNIRLLVDSIRKIGKNASDHDRPKNPG
jgi:hypothetical protein